MNKKIAAEIRMIPSVSGSCLNSIFPKEKPGPLGFGGAFLAFYAFFRNVFLAVVSDAI